VRATPFRRRSCRALARGLVYRVVGGQPAARVRGHWRVGGTGTWGAADFTGVGVDQLLADEKQLVRAS